MMNRIQHPVILEGQKVKLIPLEREHFQPLVEIARNERIWEFFSARCDTDDKTLTALHSAVLKRGTGEQYPFTILDRVSGTIIGQTMFHSMVYEWRKLEIGWTWMHPDYWGTGYNKECKLLLLTYCFEILGAGRVQLQADMINRRSCQAIAAIGATFEGVIRHDRTRDDGSFRNTAMYSIINTEWEEVKQLLSRKLAVDGQ